MSENFFVRLREYYLNVASVLRGEADVASIFPNTTDIGMSREKVYSEFLRLHAPSKCNVFLGGFLFDMNGNESKQQDIIITTDTFSPVEGTLGVVSIKSVLNKTELEDALWGFASIPLTQSLEGRVSFAVQIFDYDDWPYKVIFSTDGIDGDTLLSHTNKFYEKHPEILGCRRPQIIHVAGKYVIMRAVRGMSMKKASGELVQVEPGTYHLITRDPDLQGIVWVLNALQQHATASTEILYSYTDLINKVNSLP
jgi:hypothetical protein